MVKEKLQQLWALWRQRWRLYPVWPMGWGRYAKKRIHSFYIQKGAERRRDTIRMENFYYECVYDALLNNARHEEMTKLNQLKAKITQIHSTRLQRVMLENDVAN